jgi:hypothetical protein
VVGYKKGSWARKDISIKKWNSKRRVQVVYCRWKVGNKDIG